MTSPTETLFTQALQLEEPWTVTNVTFSEAAHRLDMHIDFPRGSRFVCPACSRADVSAYDTQDKTWRHLDFFQHQAYLHCRVPRVTCPDCGVKQVTLPWARPGSGFTLLFEALVMALAREMPMAAVARLVRDIDTKLWRIIQHYVNDARDREDYSDIRCIGIDETSRKRGHNYVTICADLDQAKVLYVTPERDIKTVQRFRTDFQAHGGDPEQVRMACCDMSPSYIRGLQKYFPATQITFDRFHVMKIMNLAVDMVRRIEQKTSDALKNTRYLWLKHPSHLTAMQRQHLDSVAGQHRQTARAYQIGLNLRDFWDQPPEYAESYLKQWYFWATHSRLKPIIEAAHTIKRHWQGMMNFITSKITNATLEGLNGLFQAARARAKGYRSTEYFSTMIYMIAGKLNYKLPT